MVQARWSLEPASMISSLSERLFLQTNQRLFHTENIVKKFITEWEFQRLYYITVAVLLPRPLLLLTFFVVLPSIIRPTCPNHPSCQSQFFLV